MNKRRTSEASADKTLASARRQGWMLDGTEQQCEDWREECLNKGVDWLTVTRRGKHLHLACLVHPNHQLSELAYREIGELLTRLGRRTGTIGMDYRGNASGFEACLPTPGPVEELAEDVLEILRNDRTPRRRIERQASSGLIEGMAVALDLTGLWESHTEHERVYVMEMQGQPGRCIVLKHLHPPLIDLPLRSFRILPEVDV